MTDAAEKMLFDIFKNEVNALCNKTVKNAKLGKLWTMLHVISLMKISTERFKSVIELIIKLLESRYYVYDGFKNINDFVVKQFNNDRDGICVSSLQGLACTIAKMIQTERARDYNKFHIQSLFRNCCVIVAEIDNSLLIGDKIVNGLLQESSYPLLIATYPSVGDNMKVTIKEAITVYLNTEFTPEIYHEAVIADIISPAQDFEEKLFNSLQDAIKYKRTQYERGVKSYPDHEELVLHYCLALYLNDKLLDTDKFIPHFTNSSDEISFLYDMDAFDYEKFDLRWLSHFNPSLMQKISDNSKANTMIRDIYKQLLLSGEYDESDLKSFFEYFD